LIDPIGDSGRGGTAAALRWLADHHRGRRLTIADLLAALGDQGFGLLLLVLALPNAVPGPTIPGFSVPFAIATAALGAQLACGLQAPRLPAWLQRLGLERQRFRRLIGRAEPLLLRVEHWLRPRPSPLSAGPGERLVGVVLVVLSAVLALPVPLGNTPVGISMMIVALGLLERDGLALMLGVAAGGVAILWNALLVFAGAELFGAALRLHWGGA
jgi:hypothetical protein